MKKTILLYIHDPMCSWCWGFRSSYAALIQGLPETIVVEKILGGLAKDTDTPMSPEMQLHIQENWKRIEKTVPGVKFNFDFWNQCVPKRSTYPACRAIIAAGMQDEKFKDLMLYEIQSAYYEQARNPSELEVLVQVAKVIGLDAGQFENDLRSEKVNQMLQAEIEKARQLHADTFPSLVLQLDAEFWRIPVDYVDPSSMLEMIDTLSVI